MDNFQEIARDFVEMRGARQVRDAFELETSILELAADPREREAMGRRAMECVQKHQGGIHRTVQEILRVARPEVNVSN